MLHRYEILLLTVPEITQDEIKNIESDINRLMKNENGTIISFERWGKYKLTYPIRRNDYGVYFLARFEVPNGKNLIKELQTLFKVKLHDVVMRNMISHLDMNQSLAYQRPKSLEESPSSHDVSTFLKENKMEGLLSSVEESTKSSKKEEKVIEELPEEYEKEITESEEE